MTSLHIEKSKDTFQRKLTIETRKGNLDYQEEVSYENLLGE